jgi:SEC-C motif-containing protein
MRLLYQMTNKISLTECPCGSGKKFADCCGPYLEGTRLPKNPEALMRSRYTAYSMANIDYIQATMKDTAAAGYDPESAKEWASKAKWKRLQVFQSYLDPNDAKHGFVEFSAFFILEGKPQRIHELSEFKCEDDKWYYVNGILK